MSVVMVGTTVVGTGFAALAGLYGTVKLAEAAVLGEAESLFAARFPTEWTAIQNNTATAPQQDEWNAFAHSYSSWRLADLASGVLSDPDASLFSHFIGDGREEFTQMTGANDMDERNKDDWNNGFGRDLFDLGLTQTQVADRLEQELLDNRASPGSSDLIVNEDTDTFGTRPYTGPRALPDGNLFDDLRELAEDYGWAWDNPGPIVAELPAWLQPILGPLVGVPGVNPAPGQNLGGGDPLVIDLDGDGIELSSLANSSVHFDLWNDAFAERTAWVDADDGILVRDINDNGLIEGVAEMFGSPHPLGYLTDIGFSELETANGFAQLALLDSNSDGVISSADAAWSEIKVWRDLNQNGASDAGELITLAAANIASIDVSNWDLDTFNGFSNGGFGRSIEGNTVTHSGFLTMTDTTTREMVDVWLQNDHADTFYAGDYTLDPRVLFLPTVRGYGMLPDLHIAMSQNEDLLDMVKDFALARATPPEFFEEYGDVRNEVRDILLEWAGVDVEGTESPSYETHGLFEHLPEFYFLRKFAGIESEYVGTWFDQSGYLPYVSDGMHAIFESWNKVVDAYAARLIFQTGGEAMFEGAAYNQLTDEFEGDLDLLQSAVDDLETAASSATDKELFWHGVAKFIDSVKGLSNLTGTEIGWLDDAVDDSTSSALSWADILDTLEPNTISGTSGADTLTGTRWSDEISGGAGNDTLSGGDGNDVLTGGTGINDTGNDTLSGGLGNDILIGQRGSDTYHYDYGHDVIVEYGDTAGDTDIIVFGNGITVSDVTLNMARIDQGLNRQLFLDIEGRGTLAVQGHYSTINAINLMGELHFADTTVIQFDAADIAVYGTDNNDTYMLNTAYFTGITSIYGFGGDDALTLSNAGSAIFDGGSGNDTLRGGAGNDSYVVSAGIDVVTEGGGTDTILIPEGYTLNDISFFRIENGGTYSSADEIKIVVDGLGSIIVSEQFFTNSASKAVEYLKLADNTQVDLYSQVYTARGTEGDDTFSAKSSFWAQQDDIYEFNGSIGNDQAIESGGYDILRFDEGILPGDITVSRVKGAGSQYWDDLRFADGAGNSITVLNHFNATSTSQSLERAEFANATVWDIFSMEIQTLGTNNADTIDSYNLGDASTVDLIYGYDGNDQIDGGAGNNEIHGGDGNDNLYGGNDVDYLYGDDGTDSLSAGNGNDFLYGGSGNDTLNGGGNDDFIEGGAGDDAINGGGISGGIDTITYANASGAVTVSLATTSAQNTGGDGTDTISYVENLFGSAYGDTLTGSTAANTIKGGDGNDTISGGNGNDILYGQGGADTLTGGANADTFMFEALTALSASDTITDFSTAQVDKLDVSDILESYNPLTHAISDFVRLTDNGTNSFLSVDQNGGGDSFTQIAQLSGVTNIAAGATATEGELQTLIANGMLIAA